MLVVGEVGYVVEFGRPTVGVRFRDIEKMTKALAAIGIEFEQKNPVTHMMTDKQTGKLREDILNEKILSAIVEFKTRLENVPAVLQRVEEVSKTLETVVSRRRFHSLRDKDPVRWMRFSLRKDSHLYGAKRI